MEGMKEPGDEGRVEEDEDDEDDETDDEDEIVTSILG